MVNVTIYHIAYMDPIGMGSGQLTIIPKPQISQLCRWFPLQVHTSTNPHFWGFVSEVGRNDF